MVDADGLNTDPALLERLTIEIWQDGLCVASVDALEADARREAAHYALIYGQDGPVEIREKKRRKGPLKS